MPQPIDLQTEVARMTLTERLQDLSGRAALAGIQRDQREEERNRAEAQRAVPDSPEAQSEHVDEDGRRKNPFVGRRRRKDSREDNEPRAAMVFYTPDERTAQAEDPDDHGLDVIV